MALFCMIFGVVVLIAFLFSGYALASVLLMENILNVLSGTLSIQLSDIFRVPTSGDIGLYVRCILIMGFFGVMLGLGIFMNGLNYRKLERIESLTRRVARRQSQRDE